MPIDLQTIVPVFVTVLISGVTAGISYGWTRSFVGTKSTEHDKNIARLEATLNTLMSKVVYVDSCAQCEKRWSEKNTDLKDDVRIMNNDLKEVKNKLDQVLLLLAQQGGIHAQS